MARLESSVLVPHVTRVLLNAAHGKGNPNEVAFLTAYQIFKRVPGAVQDALRNEYGASGREAGHPFGPASRLAQVADQIPGIEKVYLDTGDLAFDVAQSADVEAGYRLCALFRLPASHVLRQP